MQLATLARLYAALVRALDLLANLFALYLRIWVSWVFLKSGLLKLESWDRTNTKYPCCRPRSPRTWARSASCSFRSS
jgi:uncharacterized membrane protein YphA (DoxX/SURF4 family)